MKKIKYILYIILIAAFMGCSQDEDNFDYLNSTKDPSNISALFLITNDNTGKVTIRPNGEGVSSYQVFFGDASNQSQIVAPGASAQHTYTEGQYTVKIIATNLNGKTTEYTQLLTVTFVAPTNLIVTAEKEAGNPFKLNVTAKANFETYFDVYFGDVPNEVPQQFNEGQTISHVYASIGTYTLRVVAHSGGVATTETTQQINIFNPLLLPINFDSSILNYDFVNFGGATSTVVNNPAVTTNNPSSKVARLQKAAGSEVWAGSLLQLDEPIDFTTLKKIRIRSYSPVVGAVIKMKLENLTDSNINYEVDVPTTLANTWETLVFDFTAISTTNSYQKIVIFYDFGNPGNGANYYFDDIKQTNSNSQIEFPLTFEDNSLTYTFSNFGGAGTGVANNPSVTGINVSAKVAQFNKPSGTETWAGSFIDLAEPIDFTNLKKIKIKVWSPQSGIPVLLKLENLSNGSINVERTANTTIANGWEELTYDFTGVDSSNNYQRLVLFFNFGTSGTGENYYFDDLKLSN